MKRITILCFSILLVPMIMLGQETEDIHHTNITQISLAYPIGTAGTKSFLYTNNASLNLTYGLNGGVRGVEFGGISNFNKGKVEGLQVGGVANINTEASSGAFLAGVVNINRESVSGLQAAGVVNLNVSMSKGWMIAGVLNSSEGTHGAQIAGVANISAKDAKGLQLSGIANTAADVDGLQLAGVINVAKTVKGVQIASLINIADTSDYSIALINIIKSGEKSLSVALDETNTMLLSFRSGGRVLYSILGVGYNFKNSDFRYAAEGGFGAWLVRRDLVRLRVEAVTLSLSDFKNDQYFRTSFRILPSIRKGDFEIMAGPTINYVNTDQLESKNLVKNYLWEEMHRDNLNGLYIGFIGGINFIF